MFALPLAETVLRRNVSKRRILPTLDWISDDLPPSPHSPPTDTQT